MLASLVVVVLGQSLESVPLPPAITRENAAQFLANPLAGRQDLNQATSFLAGVPLTSAEVAVLSDAVSSASRADFSCDDHPSAGDFCNCMSPAGLILWVLDSATPALKISRSVAAAAGAITRQPQNGETSKLAWNVLARAGDPTSELHLCSLLLERDPLSLYAAADLLRRLPSVSTRTKAAVRDVLRVTSGKPGGGASGLSRGLREAIGFIAQWVAQFAEPWALAIELEGLSSRSVDVRSGLVRGLSYHPPTDPRVLALLMRLAQCDASGLVATEARVILETRGLAVPEGSCPKTVWSAEGRVVRGLGEEVLLTDLSGVPPPVAACAAYAAQHEVKALGMVGVTCVLGIDEGEFGGGLQLWREGRVEVVAESGWLNPVALLRRGHEVLVVSSLRHGLGWGTLTRLSSDDGETFAAEELVFTFPAINAWAVSGTHVFLSLDPDEDRALCISAPREAGAIGVYEADGSWSLIRNEATACRWPASPK